MDADSNATRMNAPFRREEPAVAPLPTTDHEPDEEMSADDPLAEWTRRMLAGMQRMTEDPEFRAAIERRTF